MAAAGFIGICASAEAVVVASGHINDTAPAGQPFFGNVGDLANSAGNPAGVSAIYLGDGWVLSAHHVTGSLPTAAIFGGISYQTEPGTFHQLQNPALTPALTTFTDIVLFRLATAPPLPGVEIATATPTVGTEVMMIGNGRKQQTTPTYWNLKIVPGEGNSVWTETSRPQANIAGYKTIAENEVRWGENLVDDSGFSVNTGSGDVLSFSTTFDSNGLTEEGQAVTGDSGGAVFSFVGGVWELSGMMVAVSTYDNQPGDSKSAVFGSQTASADLAQYRGQIMAIVPEPSVAMLGAAGLLLLVRRRR